MHTLDEIDAAQLRSDVPDFRPGDTLDVGVRVVEGNRSRVQHFQGVVIRRQGGGVRETFTVRKVSFGVGVERTFPVHTPVIESIKVVSRGDVRRAKLYYLRELRGKKAKIKEKRETGTAAKGVVTTTQGGAPGEEGKEKGEGGAGRGRKGCRPAPGGGGAGGGGAPGGGPGAGEQRPRRGGCHRRAARGLPRPRAGPAPSRR